MIRMEPHILFADDNPDICELVQTLLHAAGFRVSTSDNAADVLQRVAAESFDALIIGLLDAGSYGNRTLSPDSHF